MKILSVRVARSVWLFPTDYINPNGSSVIPVIEGVIDRYSFLVHPSLAEVFNSENMSLELKAGTFIRQDNIPVHVSLSVYRDGMVADTQSSTMDSDLFLEDVLTFLSDSFDMAPYSELPINRTYLSEIHFTLDQTPDLFSDLTDSFIKKSSSYINSDKLGKFQFMGFWLATDPGLSNNPSSIRVERVIDVPFNENRYLSSGQIKTSEHIELLEGLETVDCQSK